MKNNLVKTMTAIAVIVATITSASGCVHSSDSDSVVTETASLASENDLASPRETTGETFDDEEVSKTEVSFHEQSNVSETEVFSDVPSDVSENEVSSNAPSDVSETEVSSNEPSDVRYGICRSNTVVLSESGEKDDLFVGQQVLILRINDDTYTIEWYNESAMVDAMAIELFPKEYTPNFAAGQWAGCIGK